MKARDDAITLELLAQTPDIPKTASRDRLLQELRTAAGERPLAPARILDMFTNEGLRWLIVQYRTPPPPAPIQPPQQMEF